MKEYEVKITRQALEQMEAIKYRKSQLFMVSEIR